MTLREHRRARRWTQRELARRAGVAHRTIWTAENRLKRTRHEQRRRILRALGVPFGLHVEVFGA